MEDLALCPKIYVSELNTKLTRDTAFFPLILVELVWMNSEGSVLYDAGCADSNECLRPVL